MCREFESRRIHFLLFSSVRAGDIMNGYDSLLLDTVTACAEGKAPEITVIKSARFDELENIYFVGDIALLCRPVGSAV